MALGDRVQVRCWGWLGLGVSWRSLPPWSFCEFLWHLCVLSSAGLAGRAGSGVSRQGRAVQESSCALGNSWNRIMLGPRTWQGSSHTWAGSRASGMLLELCLDLPALFFAFFLFCRSCQTVIRQIMVLAALGLGQIPPDTWELAVPYLEYRAFAFFCVQCNSCYRLIWLPVQCLSLLWKVTDLLRLVGFNVLDWLNLSG